MQGAFEIIINSRVLLYVKHSFSNQEKSLRKHNIPFDTMIKNLYLQKIHGELRTQRANVL